MLSQFSQVQLFVTLWIAVHQVPPCIGFSSQEYWNGLPCPPPSGSSQLGDHIAGGFFTGFFPLGKPLSSSYKDSNLIVGTPILCSHLNLITSPTKVPLVKATVFPVVMYGCESWTIKKGECRRIDVFELWCWRRLLRVPWTARRSNQSILKEINPEYSLEGLMVKQKFQYFGHLI